MVGWLAFGQAARRVDFHGYFKRVKGAGFAQDLIQSGFPVFSRLPWSHVKPETDAGSVPQERDPAMDLLADGPCQAQKKSADQEALLPHGTRMFSKHKTRKP